MKLQKKLLTKGIALVLGVSLSSCALLAAGVGNKPANSPAPTDKLISSLNPESGGAIDPKAITIGQGMSKITLNDGDYDIMFNIKLLSGLQTQSNDNLSQVSELKTELSIDNKKTLLNIPKSKFNTDNTHILNVRGLKEKANIDLTVTPMNSQGQSIGGKNINTVADEKTKVMDVIINITLKQEQNVTIGDVISNSTATVGDIKTGDVNINQPITINVPQSTNIVKEKIIEKITEPLNNIIWTSSDPSVATVDQDGRVTPVRNGQAVIKVLKKSDGTIVTSYPVEVTNLPNPVSPTIPTPVITTQPTITPSPIPSNPIPTPTSLFSPTPTPSPTVTATPSAPTGLNKTNVTQTSFTLTWEAVTGTTSYKVYKDNVLYADNVNTTSKDITGLSSGTIYSIEITAVNAGGESVKSMALGVTTASSTPSSSYVFDTKWGSYGIGDGQFNEPYFVTVNPSDNVYVAESGNHRLQKFNSTGIFITKWGTWGTGDGQFRNPSGVAVDSSGNVYVADGNNDRIQKFNSTGTFITKWGSTGTGDGQFSYLPGVAVDTSGSVYVVDCNNNRIQKFNSTGTFITKWGSSGTGDGQFKKPRGVAVDTSGNVYVADNENQRIQKFRPVP